MRESKKSQLAGIAGAIGIAIIAFFLIFALNSLQWPLASSIGKVIQVLPSPTTVPEGVLLVDIVSNMTVVTQSSLTSLENGGTFSCNCFSSEGLPGVRVAVYLGGSDTATLSNLTNFAGQVEENLAPNTYTVKLLDWRLNNFTKSVLIASDQITNMTVSVNATTYTIQSANIADPDSSGWAVSWGQTYLQVVSNQSLTENSPATFLDTAYPAFTPLSEIRQGGVTPIAVGSADQSNGTQWVQIQVSSPLNISSIKSMSILTLYSSSSVSYQDVQ
jgi:hypothetical protein